jgi:hypothetical protein
MSGTVKDCLPIIPVALSATTPPMPPTCLLPIRYALRFPYRSGRPRTSPLYRRLANISRERRCCVGKENLLRRLAEKRGVDPGTMEVFVDEVLGLWRGKSGEAEDW